MKNIKKKISKESKINAEFQTEEKHYLKIDKYFTSFSFYWMCLLLISITYSIISMIFWVSVEGFPQGGNRGIEVIIEIIYIIDLFLRIVLKKFKNDF